MGLLVSILFAVVGSLLGSATRAGVTVVRARLTNEPEPQVLNISPSPAAALAAGLLGTVLGWRRAFWIGAMLGAAGMDRIDAMLLQRVGIDMDALVARATEAATDAAAKARSSEPDDESA